MCAISMWVSSITCIFHFVSHTHQIYNPLIISYIFSACNFNECQLLILAGVVMASKLMFDGAPDPEVLQATERIVSLSRQCYVEICIMCEFLVTG